MKKTRKKRSPAKAKRKAPRKRAAPLRVPPSWQDDIPAGATRAALDRPIEPAGGAPGSGAGPRHADTDPGTEFETTSRDYFEGSSDLPPLEEEQDPLEKGPPYAGPSGGAVGGAPAEKRARGGRVGRSVRMRTDHRGDSTIGAR